MEGDQITLATWKGHQNQEKVVPIWLVQMLLLSLTELCFCILIDKKYKTRINK